MIKINVSIVKCFRMKYMLRYWYYTCSICQNVIRYSDNRAINPSIASGKKKKHISKIMTLGKPSRNCIVLKWFTATVFIGLHKKIVDLRHSMWVVFVCSWCCVCGFFYILDSLDWQLKRSHIKISNLVEVKYIALPAIYALSS